MLFHGSLFPCLLLLAELSPAPACQDISRSRPYFSFCPSHTCPAFSLGPLGPSLDTLILQLVESHRSDCWAGLKLRLPQILPPPTVTAAASSALPRALCSPLTSSSSSFSRSSSLGCGQTQRVSGSPGSPQPLLPPPPCQRTPQVLLRGGIARPLCHIGVGGVWVIPSIRGPPPIVHHPNMPSGLLPHQLQHKALGTQAEETTAVPNQALGVELPCKMSSPCREPMGARQISAPHCAEGLFQQPLVR